MTRTNKQKLPALDNSGKVKNPDLATIGENNYTSTVLKYGGLAIKYPQLKTKDKTVVGAINEIQESGGGGSSTLEGLTDVDLQDPTEGQVLSYNSSDSTWENSSIDYSDISNTPTLATVATSGDYADLTNKPTIPGDLSDLGDVNITSPLDDQVLKYDATSGKWINDAGGGGGGASDLSDLDDVTITSPLENQVLKYNGSQWVNATSPAGATSLDGLTDVTITTPTAGQSLVYNSTSEEWENTAVDYSNIANKPTLATVATSGSYTDLSDTPTIPAAQVNSDWNSSSGVSQILNKPNLATVATSGSYDDLIDKPTIPSAQVQADYGQTDNTKIDYIKNKPNLATVATSGDYTDLINKPTIPPAQVNSDWDASSGVAQILNKPNLAAVATSGSYSDLSNKPTIPAAQVNSDWNAVSGVAQILNKPSLAAVATSGSYSDLTNKPTLATVATSGSYSDLSNTPTIPDGLTDLTDDVNISSPINGQVLKYDSTSSKWVNGTGGGASAVSDLTDVDLTGLEDGNSLVYDDTDDEWKVQTITKEVTQAEYDALVLAGTVDPKTAYFIKDTNGDGQDFQPIIYSETERQIGVWVDGKPLYEKTIVNSNPSYTHIGQIYEVNTTCDFSEVDEVVYMLPMALNQGTSSRLFGARTDLGGVFVFAACNYANNFIYTATTSNTYTKLIYIIRYTKTADSAGSGTWTPQGVPAHHYSTDEKVVGTWIDGKTLYEVTKSFQYDTSWGGTRAQISHGILNIDTPVDINCRFYSRESGALFKTVIRAENDVYTSDRDYYQSSLELNAQAFTSTNFVVAFGDNYYDNNINIDMVVTFRYTKSSS